MGGGFIHSFKVKYQSEKRVEVAKVMRIKYPDRIPIIVECLRQKRSPLILEKYKYLAPEDMTLSRLLMEIKKHLRSSKSEAGGNFKFPLPSEQNQNLQRGEENQNFLLPQTHAIFLLVASGQLPPVTMTLSQVYERYQDEDGFLYLWLSTEDTFGFDS